jgi:ketosteroid isomerase-like protein
VSRENVEFVLDSYARYNAGERRPELWYWHEDAEYHASSDDPDSEVHRGIDAIRKQFERWEEAYPDLKVEPLEAKDNDERVFLWVRFVGHGAGSKLLIDMELAHVLTLKDGRVRRCEEFTDRAEALAAAGLEE